MSGKVPVIRHIRRQHGRTARVAAVLGIDPKVGIPPYVRRRAGWHPPSPLKGWVTEDGGAEYTRTWPDGDHASIEVGTMGASRSNHWTYHYKWGGFTAGTAMGVDDAAKAVNAARDAVLARRAQGEVV